MNIIYFEYRCLAYDLLSSIDQLTKINGLYPFYLQMRDFSINHF